ncbi:hypothetical protein LIER_11528 [Lithospermum erythrorhizon]|uniref:CP-type G domain-containing protein n=1 Tax=Lithospermum erythrorhizon TaxID=34254 RepID=A0AAV3PPT0_LITER
MVALLLTVSALSSSTNKWGFHTTQTHHLLFPTLNLFSGFYIYNKEKQNRNKEAYISLSVNASGKRTSEVIENKGSLKGQRKVKRLILSEGRVEDENDGLICPGCGIFMQDEDPNLPGYYKESSVEEDKEMGSEAGVEGLFENELELFDDDEEDKFSDGGQEGLDDDSGKEEDLKTMNVTDWDSEEWESDFEDGDDDLEELDGFSPAGVGYGNVKEEVLDEGKKKRLTKSERKRIAREASRVKESYTVCARCHSLRNYGQVKNRAAENLIPDFDFDRLVATRLLKPTGTADSTVVVMVVDCVDFDGSFPKRAARSLFKALDVSYEASEKSKRLPKLVLVATKVDLLPSQISPARLDKWVRHRAKANGAPKLSGVYMVSARKDLGVKNLLEFIKNLAGPRGNVWVIGAQNAGKSTLINAFAKKGGSVIKKLTEAQIPGTTLGILRIGGILSAKAKMYDTPGLLHPYLLSMRLNSDEQKMVELRKELRPRTYRIKQGQTVHVGGMVRLDLDQTSVDTIYITVWVSPNVSLHLGKTENADEMKNNHAGVRLQPPIGVDRDAELGTWKKKEIKVSGISWDVNSMDVSVAGLGWFSVGFKGNANLTLWTYDGIETTLREPLVLDRAPSIERPGFLLPKAISDALANQGKLEAQAKKGQEDFVIS